MFSALLMACSHAPDSGVMAPTALENHALRLLSAGKYVEARGIFRQAFDTNPQSLVAALGFAQAATGCGERSEAERALRVAMDSNPRSPEAKAMIGRAALHMARLAQVPALAQQYAVIATRFLQAAAREKPQIPGLLLHMGTAELLAGRHAVAEPLLLRAFDLERSAESAAALARCWQAMGVGSRAKAMADRLREAGALDPAVEAAFQLPSR